jgi:hypothetical protein
VGAKDRTVGRRQRIAAQLELHPEKQCPLRARDQAAEVERLFRRGIENLRVHQQVKGVAGVSSRNAPLGKILLDEPAVFLIGKQVAALAVNSPLQRVGGGFAFPLELRPVQRTEDHLRPVAQKSPRRDEVFPCRAVNQGVRSAVIVPHHAADHRSVGGGGFRSEHQPLIAQEMIEFVPHHARLHGHPARFDIEIHDFVKVPTAIDHDSRTHHLTGQRGARRSWNERRSSPRGEADQRGDIRFRFRKSNRQGEFLIFRGIGRVELPGQKVGMDPGTERSLKFGDLIRRTGRDGIGALTHCEKISPCPMDGSGGG